MTSIFEMLGLDLAAPDHTTLSRRGRHLDIALLSVLPVGDATCALPDSRVRRIDNVRRREARAQCSGQAEPIHGEDLIEAFSNARCCIGPVALEPRGVLVKLAQALLSLELPGGAQGGPCLVVLRSAFAPSTTNSRRRSGRIPRATRSSSRAVVTVAFSEAPLERASSRLRRPPRPPEHGGSRTGSRRGR